MSTAVPEATAERVLDVLLASAPEIRDAQIGRGTEAAGRNPSGDRRIGADETADRLLVERFSEIAGVGQVASEERSTVVDAGDGLSVAVDPLDGSKNLAANNPTGTIVGVYDSELPARGRDLVAAGFVVYGPTTTATTARAGTVRQYELFDGEQRLVEDDLALPEEPMVIGLGGGDDDWPEPVASIANELRDELKLRYSGALVADVSQVLTRGGLFGYPQLRSSSQGKLRHQFEANPMAYVLETAGGASTDGARSVLERPAPGLHARAPMYVGNRQVVRRVERRLDVAVTAGRDTVGRR